MKNKLAFIIGGSGLIGKEVVNLLLLRGVKVINLDLFKRKKDQINTLKKEKFHKFDCSKDNLKPQIFKIIKKYGSPDYFINCAYPKTKDWSDNSFKNIKLKSMFTNIKSQLISTCYLSKLIAENSLLKKKNCSIILLSSIYGLVGQDLSIYKHTSFKENISYSLSKGGLISFTKQMAAYYSKHGIRINNVCPGGVLDKSKLKQKKYKNLVKNYSNRSPIKRLAYPKEIANPIIFLCSDESSYITGSSLIVDGGWTSI